MRLDLGSEQTVTMVEIWRRNDSMVTDLANVECYAAESLDYSDKENIKYTNLTYLGKLDFEGSSRPRESIPPFRPRTRATCCSTSELQAVAAPSIAGWCVWTPQGCRAAGREPENPEENPRVKTPRLPPE